LPDFPITFEIWGMAESMAERVRAKGLRAPAMDILIAACARFNDIGMERNDSHFDWLMEI